MSRKKISFQNPAVVAGAPAAPKRASARAKAATAVDQWVHDSEETVAETVSEPAIVETLPAPVLAEAVPAAVIAETFPAPAIVETVPAAAIVEASPAPKAPVLPKLAISAEPDPFKIFKIAFLLPYLPYLTFLQWSLGMTQKNLRLLGR